MSYWEDGATSASTHPAFTRKLLRTVLLSHANCDYVHLAFSTRNWNSLSVTSFAASDFNFRGYGRHNWQLVLETTTASVHGRSFQWDIDGISTSFGCRWTAESCTDELTVWPHCTSLHTQRCSVCTNCNIQLPPTQVHKTLMTWVTENLQRHPLRTMNRCACSFNGSPLNCWNYSGCVTWRGRASKLIKTSFCPINKLSSTHLRHDISILVYLGIWRSSCLRGMRGKQKMSIWTFIITSWVFLNN